MARPICFRLLTHWTRRAASRAAWTAGSKSAIRTAMIAMTTSSSISVNARRRLMEDSLGDGPFEYKSFRDFDNRWREEDGRHSRDFNAEAAGPGTPVGAVSGSKDATR